MDKLTKEKINGTDLFFNTKYKINSIKDVVVDKNLHVEIEDIIFITHTEGNKSIYKIWNGCMDIYQFDSVSKLCKTLDLFELQECCVDIKEEFPNETEFELSEKDKGNLVDAPVFVPGVKIIIGPYNGDNHKNVRYYVYSKDAFLNKAYEFNVIHSDVIPGKGETIKFEVVTYYQGEKIPNKKIIKAEVVNVIWDLTGGGISIKAEF